MFAWIGIESIGFNRPKSFRVNRSFDSIEDTCLEVSMESPESVNQDQEWLNTIGNYIGLDRVVGRWKGRKLDFNKGKKGGVFLTINEMQSMDPRKIHNKSMKCQKLKFVRA